MDIVIKDTPAPLLYQKQLISSKKNIYKANVDRNFSTSSDACKKFNINSM